MYVEYSSALAAASPARSITHSASRRAKLGLVVVAVLALLLAACSEKSSPTASKAGAPSGESVPDAPNDGVTSKEISVGWMGDITGPTASAQVPLMEGSQAYFQMINDKGGVLGRQIKLVQADDQSNAEKALTNYSSLVKQTHVLAIMGMGGSAIIPALAPKLAGDQMVVIGPPLTVDAQLTVPYFFNNLAHYADIADVAVARASELVGGPTKLVAAVVSLNVSSGTQWNNWVKAKVEAQGGKYAGNVAVNFTNPDYRTVVTELTNLVQKDHVNAIIWHGTGTTMIGMLTQMSAVGLKLPIVGISTAATPTIYTQSPPDMAKLPEGISSFLPCNVETPGGKVLNAYLPGTKWAGQCTSIPFVQGWVDAMIAHQAMERAAKSGKLDRESFYKAMQGTFDTQGLTCNIDWSKSNYAPCATPFKWDGQGLQPVNPFATYTDVMLKDGVGK